MAVRKLTAVIDFDRLDFRQVHDISGVLAELERLAASGAIVLSKSTSKTRRADAGMSRLDEPRLQPQTRLVHEFLKQAPCGLASVEVARGLGLKEGSSNGQLNSLLKLGLARHQPGERDPRKGRTAKRWFAVGEAAIKAIGSRGSDDDGDGPEVPLRGQRQLPRLFLEGRGAALHAGRGARRRGPVRVLPMLS
jgi:hypothetical protein